MTMRVMKYYKLLGVLSALLFSPFCRGAEGMVSGNLFSGSESELATLGQMTLDRLPAILPQAVQACQHNGAADVLCAIEKAFELSGQSPDVASESARECLEIAQATGYVLSFSQSANPAGIDEL